MNIINEIFINQYAQGIITNDQIIKGFCLLSLDEKRKYLSDLINYIQQSKPQDDDISKAISGSKLKTTYTPCIMLKKGVFTHNLLTISKLPENEMSKVLTLFLSLFKTAYLRRYLIEKNNPDKWWYWDLSNKDNIEKLKLHYKIEIDI